MSFPEVLAAARALPRAEKLQLMHALVDDVGGAPPPDGGLTAAEVEFVKRYFPPGTAFEEAPPMFSPESAALLDALLADHKASGVPFFPGTQITTDEAGRRAVEQAIAELKGAT